MANQVTKDFDYLVIEGLGTFKPSGAGGGGAVNSVNGKTGVVVLDASDVGALPDDTPIPTKTSDLTNDSGFVTAQQAAASAPVQSVNGKTGAVVLGAADVHALPDSTVIPPTVTEQTVAGWGFTKNTGTYSKPSGGIPKSDLASDVQTSLGKADTALQTAPVTSVNTKTGAVTLSASDVGALPSSTTIPAKTSDLTNDSGFQTAAQVQTAISGKLDTAQGAANAGKFMVVGSDGNIAPVTITAWQGGSY